MASSLNTLLELWRLSRNEGLASEIEATSDQLAALGRPRPVSDWFRSLRSECAESLSMLFATLPAVGDARLARCLDTLWAIPVDPRIATAIYRLVLQQCPRSNDLAFWNRALSLLAWVDDARSADWLSLTLNTIRGPARATRELIQRANELIAFFARNGRATTAPRRRERLQQPTPPPQEPAARAVFADALLDRGDARGERLLLESSQDRASRRRMRELETEYGRAWLGRLSSALKPDGLRFRNGAVVAGRLSGFRAVREIDDACEWATLEELDLQQYEWSREACEPFFTLLRRKRLERLRCLQGFPDHLLSEIVRLKVQLPIRELGLVGWRRDEQLRALLPQSTWPKLERVTRRGATIQNLIQGAP